MNHVFRNSRNILLAALMLSTAAFPALAEDPGAIADRAITAYNAGIDAENAGNYADACISYRDAADRFESAIYALMGQSMQTQEERDGIKAYADMLQEKIDIAKENARRVCNK